MDKMIEMIKTLLEGFFNQISLSAILLTGTGVAVLIFMDSSNMTAKYVAFGCLLFLCMNTFIKHIPKFYKYLNNAQFKRRFSHSESQAKILSKWDTCELEILKTLYEIYPDMKEFNDESPDILKLRKLNMLVPASQELNGNGKTYRMFALQSWVKRALDSNTNFIQKGHKHK